MSPKNPTNADLLKELRTVKDSLKKIDGRVDKNDTRIEQLEIWKISTEASRAAVEQYKHETLTERVGQTRIEVFQRLLPFIVALTALAYAIITYLGRTR